MLPLAPDMALDRADLGATVAKLQTDEALVARTRVSELFEFARDCVASGKFALRDAAYRLIETHPKATDEDRGRVLINSADGVRRKGTEVGALSALEMVNGVAGKLGPMAEAERLQVAAQAHLVLYRVYSGSSDERAAGHARNAVDTARNILGLTEGNAIPLDRKAFYHQSFVGISLSVGQLGPEVDAVQAAYLELLGQMPSSGLRLREQSQAHCTTAIIESRRGNPQGAFDNLVLGYRIAEGEYYRIGPALEALELLHKGVAEDRPGIGAELRSYVIDAVPRLEPGLFPAHREAIDRARAYIPGIPARE